MKCNGQTVNATSLGEYATKIANLPQNAAIVIAVTYRARRGPGLTALSWQRDRGRSTPASCFICYAENAIAWRTLNGR